MAESIEKLAVIALGSIIMIGGLFLIIDKVVIDIPYDGTITVYPYQVVGAIVLLIGAVSCVIGFAIPDNKESVASYTVPEFCCGKCPLFRTEKCERKELNYNMAPCPKYYTSRASKDPKYS